MDQKSAESKLSIAYALTIALGATSAITSGIAWGHWKTTLDHCVGKNCSCILYATHTPLHFLGGDAAACIWISFGPLIHMLFGIAMSCFHGYRVLFMAKEFTRTITTRNEVGETVTMQAVQETTVSSLPRMFWIILSAISCFFTLYTIIHFSIFTDGFLHTCRQFRVSLEKILGVSGTAVAVVHNRLSCQAIYDFMDYVQPDSINSYRDGFINTGLDLIIGIVASFATFILFLISSVINVKLVRSKQ